MNLIIRLKNLWMVVAIIAIAFLLISAATSALTIPDVFVSSTTGECVKVDNFDPDRGNPFAYFTQIIYYAFLRRIQKEKKQLEIKSKILERSGYDEVLHADRNELNFSSSDYNSIKQNIEQKTRK